MWPAVIVAAKEACWAAALLRKHAAGTRGNEGNRFLGGKWRAGGGGDRRYRVYVPALATES